MECGTENLHGCWDKRDVMVGVLHDAAQLDANAAHRFYHIPAKLLACPPGDIGHVALYQSKRLFGKAAGIRLYGRVGRCDLVPRGEIHEIPARGDPGEPYFRFGVAEWETLPRPIRAVGLAPGVSVLTTLFLLRNSRNFPELYIRTLRQWELYSLLRAAAARTSRNGGSERIPASSGNTVMVAGRVIGVYTPDGRYEQYNLREFLYRPHTFLTRMLTLVEGEDDPS